MCQCSGPGQGGSANWREKKFIGGVVNENEGGCDWPNYLHSYVFADLLNRSNQPLSSVPCQPVSPFNFWKPVLDSK
jgi:hypothetical protein